MKALKKIFLVGLIGILGLGVFLLMPKHRSSPLDIRLDFQKKTLPNGLKVVFIEDHTLPLVSFQTWYKVGSVDEYPGVTGISHLFERLMFRGTSKYGPKKFFQELETKGAEINAVASRDYTVYYENFSSDLLEKVIDLESDRMSNLVLTQEVLDNEKRVVFEERRIKNEGIPEGRMLEALWQIAYRYHPYQWPLLGYPTDVFNLTLTQVLDYYKVFFQPANASLVLVGDFRAEQAFNWIKKYYGKIPSVQRPKRVFAAEPPQGEEHRLILREQISNEKLVMGYHICSGEDADSYALDIAANILFEGASSRAHRRLVEEKQLLSDITGSAYTPAYPGLFIISGTMNGKLPTAQAEVELSKLFGELGEGGVSQEEMQMAVKQLTLQLVDTIRTPYGLGQLVGTVETIFGDPSRILGDISKYEKVTSADVQRVAKKYFDPNNRTVVTMVKK